MKTKITLHEYGVPKQLDFARSKARFRAFYAGRRSGKTYSFLNDSQVACLSRPNTRYLYLTHSNPLAREQFEILGYHQALRPFISHSFRREPYRIEYRNGSVLEFRNWSNIGERIRGHKYHAIWVDEIQHFPEHLWPVLEACIRDTRGRVAVSGQFNGYDWAYHKFYAQGQSSVLLGPEGQPLKDRAGNPVPNMTSAGVPLYASWHMRAGEGLRFLGKLGQEELELVRMQCTPNVWDQEWDCLPTASMDSVFDNGDIENAIVTGKPPERRRIGHSYILSIDLAREVDFSAAVMLEVETGLVAWDKVFPRGYPYHKVGDDCRLVKDAFGATCICDSTGERGAAGGKRLYGSQDTRTDEVRKAIPDLRPHVWTMQGKNHMCTELGIALRQKAVRIPEGSTELLRQLHAYRYKYRSSGFLTYGAPKNDHDDLVAALMQATWAKRMHWYSDAGAASGYVPSGV